MRARRAFFRDRTSFWLANLRYGDDSKVFPRTPRAAAFDEVARLF
jgi:hypothetical protein